VGDLYNRPKKEIFVVKIGEPRDFSYAFDQASVVLNNMKNSKYILNNSNNIYIKFMNILLIFRKNRELNSPMDTKSLIFEIKLNELYRLAQEKGVKLKLLYTTIL